MTQTTEPCPEGHQWHDTTTGKVCAACLLEAPADPIKPDADDDPKHHTTKLSSDFALLDVKKGRAALLKATKGNRIPVTITGYIVGPWSDDDGTNREFEVEVTGVQVT